MPERQVIIIGLGPAGLAAAAALDGLGLDVLLIDEQPQPGGQFLRGPALGLQNHAKLARDRLARQGQGLMASLQAGGLALKSGVQVLGLEAGGLVWGVDQKGAVWRENASAVILATGARERFVPFPGWTLPGVISTGAAQIMLKSSGILPGPAFLVGGAGPLPLSYAGEHLAAGGKLAGFWDQPPFGLKLGILRHLRDQWSKIGQGIGHLARLKLAGVPLLQGYKVLECRGQEVLRRVVLARVDAEGRAIPGSEQIFELDCLALGHGFTPNLELASLAGCELEHSPQKGGWVVKVDAHLMTSLPGILAAGELTGVAGAAKSYLEGRQAGLCAAMLLDAVPEERYKAEHARLYPKRQKEQQFGAFINRLCRPPKALLADIPDETIICRCEEITLGQIRQQVGHGFLSLDAIKKTTSSTMGKCQGRTCGPILQDVLEILAPAQGEPVQPLSIRSPVKPVSLGALAGLGGRMSMLKIAVSGAAGRMGGAVIKAVDQSPELELGAALVRPGHPWAGQNAAEVLFVQTGGVRITDDPMQALESCEALIDFSQPEASVGFARLAAQTGKALVTGTSGFTPEHQAALVECSQTCPLVRAGNMSQGVAVMLGLVTELAQFLGDDYAVEVLEAYHDQKKDAPGGTAMEMVKALAAAHEWQADQVSKHGRHGFTGPRPQREIGVHAIRGGDLTGENSVFFIGRGERLEVTYRSQSRKPAVQGALKAAAWAVKQKPGLYGMRDVLGL